MHAVTLQRSGDASGQGQPAPFAAYRRRTANRGPVAPLTGRMQVVRATLVLVLVLTGSLLMQLVIISDRQQASAERRSFDRFRSQLATGTAPIGPADQNGDVLKAGDPVAYVEIPSIDVHQVVGESTTSAVLFNGLGHRRDTPLPGQIGTSVVFGRRSSYGGPFARISNLAAGAAITVTTGQGTFEYSVIGLRRAGDPVPPGPAKGSARLVLVTADGSPYVPNGVLRVDADLVGTAVGGPARLVTAAQLPAQERELASDTRTLWALAFWLQALIALSLLAVWGWHRWGRAQTWIVLLPVLTLVGLAVSQELARLLPNLL